MNTITETQLTDEQKSTLRYVARLITVGSKGHVQVQGRYFKPIEDQAINGCCSIGACLIAAGAPETNSLVLSEYLNIGNWPEISYPDDTAMWNGWNDGKQLMNLTDVIMQLNDAAGWTFRRIAAYLRLAAQKGIVTTTRA